MGGPEYLQEEVRVDMRQRREKEWNGKKDKSTDERDKKKRDPQKLASLEI